MDQQLRNALRRTVEDCRKKLEADYRRQAEAQYGVDPDGRLRPLEHLPQLDTAGRQRRQTIEQAIAHERAGGADAREAVERYLRESAFTALNRLAALKLMEVPSRRLIAESVGRDVRSAGFKQFQRVAPLLPGATADGGYQLYLELLFDDLAQELGVIFDRRLPQSVIFPTHNALRAVLDALNSPEIAAVWDDEETIGWIYQYFTPREQREQARKESQAPRNSYELAFRNQFYTPRYVVQFLVDNTLGRLWYEMRQGNTRLAEQCRYLVYRPGTVFLGPDETPPADDVSADGAATDHVSYRPKKDPRTLRVLDPACGSGHFLLYCYDVLETIYDEAWEDDDSPGLAEVAHGARAVDPAPRHLREQYPTREALRRELPRLIMEHHLHGIDIDLRATQIAALALWLRGQRTYQELGLRVADRPRITRSWIVCAEPMPGERGMLDEFLAAVRAQTSLALQADLVAQVWEAMRDADEIGSLLKIEVALREHIARARHEQDVLLADPRSRQEPLFPDLAGPRQTLLPLDQVTDDTYWAGVEERVLTLLRAYAESQDNRYVRRLFSRDAAEGFAFVDLLRRRFDVVLMNPPFGEPSKPSKHYVERHYPRTKNDVYAAFVERGLELLEPHGLLGAITSRTGFFLTTFQKWREEILLKEARPTVFADLGYGVLDTAMVETAAYCLERVPGGR